MCGMVIKRKKDVKNTTQIDYIGYTINMQKEKFTVKMKEEKCHRLCEQIKAMLGQEK